MTVIQAQQCRGMTLMELMIAMSIVAILGGICAKALAVAIESWKHGRGQNDAVHDACWALDRIVSRARSSNRLLLPFIQSDPNDPRDFLAFSAMVDTDGDGYIDEDYSRDISGDGAPGILGIDDDGDGYTDEGWYLWDDDEDGLENEDWIDGSNNDGDGYLNEDPSGDINGDGRPGVYGKDDDGDGKIDEDSTGLQPGETGYTNNLQWDDDEDGVNNEDPIEYWLYYLDPNGCLMERYFTGQPEVLVQGVTTFQVTRMEDDSHTSGIRLTLGVTPPQGEEITLKTQVYLRGLE